MADDPKRPTARSTHAAGVSGARAAQAVSLQALGAWWDTAERRVPGPTLAGWAIEALETMGEDDTISWGMRACDVLRRHGTAAELERLEAVRPRLPRRVGLRDWRLEASRALSVIRARSAGDCTCAAEASHGAPVFGPQWTVEAETIDRAQYATILQVRCACGQRWRVTRQEGYHYPVFRWAQRPD